MDALRVCRGYFELPSKISENVDEQIQLIVTLKGEEFTYVFPVRDAYGYSADPETVIEMAKIFGGDGDMLTDWTENSSPYFDEMKPIFSSMSDDSIKETIVLYKKFFEDKDKAAEATTDDRVIDLAS